MKLWVTLCIVIVALCLCWSLDAPAGSIKESRLGPTSVEFTDSFPNITTNWTLFGEPTPVHLDSIFLRKDIFDNNGDVINSSGGISKTSYELDSGFTIESEVYLDFSNADSCFAAAAVGIANPTQQGWGGYDSYVYFTLAAEGQACSLTPDSLKGHAYFFGGYLAEAGWRSFAPDGTHVVEYRADAYANGWHVLKIRVNQAGVPVFVVDEDTVFVGTDAISSSVLSTAKPLWLGTSSSGKAGKAYHNYMKFVSGPGCDLPAKVTLISPAHNAQVCSGPVSTVWHAAALATKYRLQVSGDPAFGTTLVDYETPDAETTYVISTIIVPVDCAQLYWRVRAVNDCGNGAWSTTFNLSVCGTPSTPSRVSPGNGAIDVAQPVTLRWDSLTTATRYWIQLDDSASFSTPAYSDSSITKASKLLPTLIALKKYYWRIRARNNCSWGNWTASAWDFTTRSGCATPSPPTRRAPANGTQDLDEPITVDWDSSSTAIKYNLQIDDSIDFNSPEFDDTTLTATGLIIADSILAGNTTYYWRLRGFNTACGWGVWHDTEWSFETRVPCPLPNPPSLYLPPHHAQGLKLPILLDWGVGPESKYRLMVDDSPEFSSPAINIELTVSNYSCTTLDTNKTYYWTVSTHNSCGWGDWNATREFTVGQKLDVEDVMTAELPTEFTLSQNYPNPFNPITAIEFAMARSGDATLDIFDITGRRVRVLVDEYLSVGMKRVIWDGRDASGEEVSSGVYFYRLRAGEFVETKKMVLLK